MTPAAPGPRRAGDRSVWLDVDSAADSWDPSVAEHVSRYLRTDGAEGFMEGGVANLVLTTVGRRTGALRRTALFFGVDGSRQVLVASGSVIRPHHPGWYLNVVANPEVHVQVRADRFIATTRTAVGEERARLWRKMTELAPIYHRYAVASDVEIPIVVLERVSAVSEGHVHLAAGVADSDGDTDEFLARVPRDSGHW